MKFIFIKKIIDRIGVFLDNLRKRIPGLPSNRAVFAAMGLAIFAMALLGIFQMLLAPKQKFTTYTLPYEQNFDDVILRNWFLGDGVWTIRDATLSQTVGGDTPAQLFIPFKLIDDSPYHASVYITLKKDTRMAGISFNAQYPDMVAKQQRIYLSKPDAKTLELVAGYMDASGSFITQVQVPLSINTTEFRIDLYVYQNTYLVQVNGQRLIQDRPLFFKNGLIGFYTLGPAIFDSFKLTAAENPNPGNLVYTSDFDQVPGGAGWVPFSGTWKISTKQMVQSDPIFINAGIGYESSSFQNFTLRVTFNHLSGQGAGVLFNMPSPYQLNGAQLVRYSDETDSIIWGSFDADGAFTRQGFSNIDPVGTETHVFQIFSGDTSYDFFLDEKIIARDVPLVSKQGNIGLITSAASAAYSLVEVFPLFGTNTAATAHPLTPVAVIGTVNPAATPPSPSNTKTPDIIPAITGLTTQLVPITPGVTKKPTNGSQSTVEVGTPNSNVTAPVPVNPGNPTEAAINGGQSPFHGVFSGTLAEQNWNMINGDWRFQNGNFVQLLSRGFDMTAIYTKSTFKNYSYQVGLTHQQGSGAGLLFNLPKSDGLTGATMVRYSDKRDNALIWGYFDNNGVYKSLGYAEVNHAGTDHHTLRVVCGVSSFSIYLDDRLVVQGVPFSTRQDFGYIGLLTSAASVTYDEVSVDGVGAAFKGNYSSLDGFTDQRIISGKWAIQNNQITQSVPETADYIWNTGVQASQYTISAKITLPKNLATSGAGFILNMPERNSKNNSYIVRLTNGGKGIWWGSTDAAGKFKGQGSAVLKPTTNSFVVKIVIDLGKMTVFVDDNQIVADVLITGQDGWIGLVSYGGPVIFEEVKLDVIQ